MRTVYTSLAKANSCSKMPLRGDFVIGIKYKKINNKNFEKNRTIFQV